MELRNGDMAKNQNIRSSCGAAEYSLTFEMVLPSGRVQFFKLSCWAAESNWQAGQGRSIRRPDKAAVGGRVRSPDRSAEAGLSIGRGRPAGEFEKQNCKRPPDRTISKVKMYEAAPREDRIFWFSAKSPSLSSIWIVYTDEPLMVFSGPIVKKRPFFSPK